MAILFFSGQLINILGRVGEREGYEGDRVALCIKCALSRVLFKHIEKYIGKEKSSEGRGMCGLKAVV